jgi:hypothetical protein
MGYPISSLVDLGCAPEDFFNAMQFELWMDNGMAVPASAQALNQIKHNDQYIS